MQFFLYIFIFHISLFSGDVLDELPFYFIDQNEETSSELGKHNIQFEVPLPKRQKIESSIAYEADSSSEESESSQEYVTLPNIESREYSQKASQNYPIYFKWVEENIDDSTQKAAFFSLFEVKIHDKYVLDTVHALPKSLVKNHLITAISIYLYSFNITSSIIYDFIMHVREGVETDPSFKATRAQLAYNSFVALKIDKLQKPPECFKGAFASFMLDYFEPFLEKITGNKFPNQEALAFLCKKYQKNITQSNVEYFHIENAEIHYKKLLKKQKGEENDLLEFLQELQAGFHEKVAFLSLMPSNLSILQKIRAAPKSLDSNSFIAALCVYLGHFGVQSEHVYSFLIKARPQAELSRGFFPSTPGTMYKNFCFNFKNDYFKRDFSFLMIEIFEPLSALYRAPHEFFIHRDTLVEKHKEYQEKLAVKNNIILPPMQDVRIKNAIYNKLKKNAYKDNPSLAKWIENSCTDSLKQSALFSLVTIEVEAKRNTKKWINVIKDANSLHHHYHLIAGIIYLSHFKIDSLYIYNFVEHIRGKNSSKREFTPVTPKNYYEKFVQDRNNMLLNPPGYLKNPTLLKAINSVFLPLLRKVTENPEAEF